MGNHESVERRCPTCGHTLERDEFVFRHNRRQTPMPAFQTLLGLGTGRAPDALSAHPLET